MEPDDERLADSLKLAYEAGMEVLFVPKSEKAEHPNSVKMLLKKEHESFQSPAFRSAVAISRFLN